MKKTSHKTGAGTTGENKSDLRKNEPNKGDRNPGRVQDQEKRERVIRSGAAASTTPQGGGVGNSTQAAMERPLSEGLGALNPRFEPIDPESERSAAENRKSRRIDKKTKASKNKKSGKAKGKSTSTGPDLTAEKHDPAHGKGEGDPSYAAVNPQQRREWTK